MLTAGKPEVAPTVAYTLLDGSQHRSGGNGTCPGGDSPNVANYLDGNYSFGGGANLTGAPRVGLAMNYCAGWMRQQENQQLGIPIAVARSFSPRLRKLVGFGLYKNLIGHIDKCSPVDLLDDAGPRPVVGL